MSQVLKNTAWLTVATVGQKVIAFLYFTVIARLLGDEAMGAYFLALALTVSVGVLDDIGLTPVLIREGAKAPGKAVETLRQVLGWKMVTVPFTVLLAWVLPGWLGFSVEATLLTRVAIAVMLADTFSVTLYGFLRSRQTLWAEGVGMFVGQVLTAAVGITALLLGVHSLLVFVAALIVGSFWNVFWSGYQIARKEGARALWPDVSFSVWLPKFGLMFFLASVLVKVSSYTDSFVIHQVLGEGAVGDYSAAYKLTYAFQFLPMAFVGALYPAFSAALDKPDELRRLLLQGWWYVALLAAPITFGIFSLAPEIISSFYTSRYAEAIPVLQILIFVLPFIFLDFPLGALLNATHRAHVKTGILAATTVLNVGANLLLVPMFGLRGAAMSALLSFGFMACAGFLAVRKVVAPSLREVARVLLPPFGSGAVMMGAVFALRPFLPWPLLVVVGGVVYVGCLFALGGVKRQDLLVWRRFSS